MGSWAPPAWSATVDREATDGPFFDMTTKDIRTSHAHTVCDVCGRTLLRGERAETYINGDARRSVCELCKSRALNEGWVREGTLPGFDRLIVGHFHRPAQSTDARVTDAGSWVEDPQGHPSCRWGTWVEVDQDGIRLFARTPDHLDAITQIMPD